jgi:molybdenum cofactor sulfurtransferase
MRRRGAGIGSAGDGDGDGDDELPLRLFAYASECNLTGQRLSGSLARHVQAHGLAPDAGGAAGGRWLVLVDAARACASAPPDLAAAPADLVALSFAKILGAPTGLGALLVRRRLLPLLARRRRYFGGGTVEAVAAGGDFVARCGCC